MQAELLINGTVIVNTAFGVRLLQYDLVIGNGDSIDDAKKVILDVIRGTAGVATDPAPDVLVTGYADNGLALRMRWWINPPRRADALDASDVILAGVKIALTKAGIDLPFPTQQFLFHDQTEATDGDRRAQREGWPSGDREVPAPRPVAAAIMAQQKPAAEAGQQG
jgi:small conductance mechanosensitive channel